MPSLGSADPGSIFRDCNTHSFGRREEEGGKRGKRERERDIERDVVMHFTVIDWEEGEGGKEGGKEKERKKKRCRNILHRHEPH